MRLSRRALVQVLAAVPIAGAWCSRPRWRDGDAMPRVYTHSLTAELAERHYPKADWLRDAGAMREIPS